MLGWRLNKAYFKMQNVLVDDRRIWVDLCERLIPLPGAKADDLQQLAVGVTHQWDLVQQPSQR